MIVTKPDCHVNAFCTNCDGSYSCECKKGYTGNGLRDNYLITIFSAGGYF